MFCSNCGESIQNGIACCPKCGCTISATDTKSPIRSANAVPKNKQKRKTVIIFSTIAALLIVFMFIISAVEMLTPEKIAEKYITGLMENDYYKIESFLLSPSDEIRDIVCRYFPDLEVEAIAISDTSLDDTVIPNLVVDLDLDGYVDPDDLIDVHIIDVKVSAFQKNENEYWPERTLSFYVAKHKGVWKVLTDVRHDYNLISSEW